MKSKKKNYLFFIVVMTMLLLFACSNRDYLNDLKNYVQNMTKRNGIKDRGSSFASKYSIKSVVYQAPAMRTPFDRPRELNNANRQGQPLTQFPLTVLRFVGTVTEGNRTWAVIATPDNKIYKAVEGDTIGDRLEKIVTIRPDRVEIVEQTSEDEDHRTKRIITLELKEEHR